MRGCQDLREPLARAPVGARQRAGTTALLLRMIIIIAPSHNRDCRLPGVGQTDNCRLGFTAFVIIRARPGFGRWRGFDKRWCLSHSFGYQCHAFAGRSANDLISARNEPRAVRATNGSADFPSEARRGGLVVLRQPHKYPGSIAHLAQSSRPVVLHRAHEVPGSIARRSDSSRRLCTCHRGTNIRSPPHTPPLYLRPLVRGFFDRFAKVGRIAFFAQSSRND